jgi:hypothetical protein
MRYKIRRITTGSALRVGLMLGWLVVLCPALCLAGVAVQVLGRVGQALGRVEPIDLSVFGQEIARIDVLEILRLSDAAQTVARLTENQPLTFAMLALLLTLLGAAVFVVVAVLFSIGYNLLATVGGGLEVELTPRIEDRR